MESLHSASLAGSPLQLDWGKAMAASTLARPPLALPAPPSTEQLHRAATARESRRRRQRREAVREGKREPPLSPIRVVPLRGGGHVCLEPDREHELQRKRSRSRSRSRRRRRRRSRSRSTSRSRSPRRSRSRSRSTEAVEPREQPASGALRSVPVPSDHRQREATDRLAQLVAESGAHAERAAVARADDAPELAFLRDRGSAGYRYYRWRVWALANGDSMHKWREESVRFVQRGDEWRPPRRSRSRPSRRRRSRSRSRERTRERRSRSRSRSRSPSRQRTLQPAATASESDILFGNASASVVGMPLVADEARQLDTLLSNLTPSRDSVRSVMAFALDHADCAGAVVRAIFDAMVKAQAQAQRTMVRAHDHTQTLMPLRVITNVSPPCRWRCCTACRTYCTTAPRRSRTRHRSARSSNGLSRACSLRCTRPARAQRAAWRRQPCATAC